MHIVDQPRLKMSHKQIDEAAKLAELLFLDLNFQLSISTVIFDVLGFYRH